jgi:hypothetical protein
MVMSATEITATNRNQDRCFDRNAVDIPTEAEARAEATRRNKVEKAAGHTNVMWYAMEQITF